jgi:hypothetical protein
MWRLSTLFVSKITLATLLINFVLPITFILNDRVFGFEKTGSSQFSFMTLSLTFNLLIIPAYSLILVSQNLNWLIMMPISRIRLVLFSSLLRIYAFFAGLGLMIFVQLLMEKFYYNNFGVFEASTMKAFIANLFNMISPTTLDWSYSAYALAFSLVCVFLSGFVMNFDLETKSYRFTLSPFLFLLKGKLKAILGLIVLVLFFGLMSLSRANIFIVFSLSLPFFMYLTANVFVLEKQFINGIKIIIGCIVFIHMLFIYLAREELKSSDVSLERSINNFEYLEIYTANPNRLAQGILQKMLNNKKVDTAFIKKYFEELDPQTLYQLLNFPLNLSDVERLQKYVVDEKLDPFFFDPIEIIQTKTSLETTLYSLDFFSLRNLTQEQVLELLSVFGRKFPSSIDRFYASLSLKKFSIEEINQFLFNDDKYIVEFGLILLRYYSQYLLELETVEMILKEHPFMIEEVFKTIVVRNGELLDVNRMPLILSSLDFNRQENCPQQSSELFRVVGDKGSFRLYTLCIRQYFKGVIQPQLEHIEVIENPFYGNHLNTVQSLMR